MSSRSKGSRSVDKVTTSTKPIMELNSHNNSSTAAAEKKMKVATADQIRLAQITENSQDSALQENIEQFMAITGKDHEDASIILHDHGNDLEAAVNATFEGDTNLDAWHETTKKKKTKAKIEVENKENRKNNQDRERSASRGRGGGAAGARSLGGRGRREGAVGEGSMRGGGSRRGRMTNGGPVSARGGRGGRSVRGGRGGMSARGSSPHFAEGTFQSSRQNLSSYDDPIETWGEEPPAKVPTEPLLEDWGEEWTGSLENTSVFVQSASEPTPPPASDLTSVDAAKLVNNSTHSFESSSGKSPQSYSAAATQSVVSPGSLGGLVPTQTPLGDLATLLQQAAPQSLLTSSATTNGKVPHLQQQQQQQQPAILGGISTNVGDVIKASNSGTHYSSNAVATSISNNYSQHNSIFSTNLQNNVSRNIASSGLNVSTSVPPPSKPPGVILPSPHEPVSLPPASGHVPPRPKPAKVKQNQTSKIPLSAVELPDDVMSAINLQMTGLQFGFDFLNDGSKQQQPPTMPDSQSAAYSVANSYANPPPPVASSTYQSSYAASTSLPPAGLTQEKSLPKQPPTPQTNKQLGPEPIPFPNQITSGSTQSNNSSSNSQTSGAEIKSNSVIDSSGAPTTGPNSSNWRSGPVNHQPQSVASSTQQKKEAGGGVAPPPGGLSSGALGSLVGSGSNYPAYTLPKTSTTFPSPPTGPYSQNNVQSAFTGDSSSGYGSNQPAPSNTNGSVASASASHQQSQSGYGSAQSYGVVSTASQQYNNSSNNQSNSVHYQNSYNSSSHSLSKQLSTTPLKDTSSYDNSSSSASNTTVASVPSSLSGLQTSQQNNAGQGVGQQKTPAVSTGPPPGTMNNKNTSSVGVPQGIQQHHMAQLPTLQQQMLVQQQQQQQQQTQYVGANALQGSMPYYHGLQQMYPPSFDEIQMLQGRMPHLPQAQVPPSTMAGSRDTSMSAGGGYNAPTDVSKFRTDQNSSPVPNAINTQGTHAGYIPNTANAAPMHPMYMYHQNVAVPSSAFPYTQAIIQLPANTAGSNTNQYQAKLQYNAASGPTYYDSQQGGGDYKGNYGTATQSQNKSSVSNNSASMANSVSEMPAYKNHLTKPYEKPGAFHASTPPPFNMAGSAGPYAHAPVYLPTMAPHQNQLIHHQLHQDGSSSGGQRGSASNVQSKAASKPQYPTQFWGN